MKVALVALSLACFVGCLHAFPLQEEVESDAVGAFLGYEPEVFPNAEEVEGDDEYPTVRPRPTTTTVRPQPTTTTVRPRPTTTVRPRPSPRPQTPRPPQIYNHGYQSQGPLSGRLTNVVLNREGLQKVIQKNDIAFSLNAVRRTLEELLGNEDSE